LAAVRKNLNPTSIWTAGPEVHNQLSLIVCAREWTRPDRAPVSVQR
jgi:hypothetical protein